MRALFFGMPGHGHLLPQVPLARAFRDRGDEVAMVCAAPLAPLLASVGIAHLPAGPGLEPALAAVLRTTGQDLMQAATVEAEAELFAGAFVDLGYDDALAAARSWRPDLIVGEQFDFVGPIVGAALDLPVASLAYSPALLPDRARALSVRAARQYEARGLAYGPPRWYLDTYPDSLQLEGWRAPEGRIALRPEAHRAPEGSSPVTAGAANGRPRVLVTFGTSFVVPEIIASFVRELLTQDIAVRVTLGVQASAADFGVGSDRVEFVGFTPLAELLGDVDVVLTVGGSGTVLGSLAKGIPLVVTPLGADQHVHAERVAASGAGIAFPLRAAAPEAVGEAVATVLAEPAYRATAQKISAEISAMPSPAEVAERLASTLS